MPKLALTKTKKHLNTQDRMLQFLDPNGSWWFVTRLGSQYQIENWGVPGGVAINDDNDDILDTIEEITAEMKFISGDLRKWHVTDEQFEHVCSWPLIYRTV